MSGGRVVLAVICVVWGGGIVLTSLVEGIASPLDGAHEAGRFGGYVFGGALVLAGARTLLDVRR